MGTAEAARKERIRRVLVEAQARLLVAIRHMAGRDWDGPTANLEWTARQILTHVATVETSYVSLIRRMAAGQGGVPEDFDADRWNVVQLARQGVRDPADLEVEQVRAHRQLLELLEGFTSQELDQHGWLSSGGRQGSVEDALLLLGEHQQAHTSDLEGALTVP